jgi:hypothetical protein
MNCIYTKAVVQPCTDGVRQYKVTILQPSSGTGTCPYVQDQIITEPCPLYECGPEQTFESTLKCLMGRVIQQFITIFNNTSGDCPSQQIISQNLTLNNQGNLEGCTVNISQLIKSSTTKICADINKSLLSLSPADRSSLVGKAVDAALAGASVYVRQRPRFAAAFKEALQSLMGKVSADLQTRCSQTINISQDMVATITGTVRCTGGTLNFSQEAIVDAYMQCITGPFLPVLMADPVLKSLYNESGDLNCVYDKVLVSPCDGQTRVWSIKLIEPSKGRGSCPHKDGDIVKEECSPLSQCVVSQWSEWSSCNLDQTGKGVTSRTRTILIQGEDCPELIEEKECAEIRPRRVGSMRPNSQSRSYDWLVRGPSAMNPIQKAIALVIGLFLLALITYALL